MLSQFMPDRELWEKIKTIVLPIALQNLLIQVDSAIDSIMLGHVTVQSFNTDGDARFSFKMDVCVTLCTVVPLGLLAAFLHWSVLLIFFIVNMDEVLKLPIFIRHFFGFSWLRNLTEMRKKTA